MGGAGGGAGTEEIVRVWRNDAGLGVVVKNGTRCAVQLGGSNTSAGRAAPTPRGRCPAAVQTSQPPASPSSLAQVMQLDASGGAEGEPRSEPGRGGGRG